MSSLSAGTAGSFVARYRVGRAIAFDDQNPFACGDKLAVGKCLQDDGCFVVAYSDKLRDGFNLLVAFAERELLDRARILRKHAAKTPAKESLLTVFSCEKGPPKQPPLSLQHFYCFADYFVMIVLPSGTSGFLSLPGMYGLHGCALTGPFVFHTTLNWPLPWTSPMNTALCRW